MKKTFVHVSFTKEGYHQFPGALAPEFKTGDVYDVSHLATRHFHYFYFKVWVEVKHDNRDIEFIQLRRWLESLYDSKALELNDKSCEMIAEDLYNFIKTRYTNSEIRIDVSEDNINGAYVEFTL
jgi:4-alpha-glucanotransferase